MNPRTKARQSLVQASYQWLLTEQPAAEIMDQFICDRDMENTDVPYFQELLPEILVHKPSLVDLMTPFLSRPFAQVDPVEQAVLLVSTYELQYRMDVPYKVVINEGVELAKTFGAEEGHKFINGILDKVALSVRETEVKAKQKKRKK